MLRRSKPLSLDNPLFIEALGMHEHYIAYQQAGFTPEESMQLCTGHIMAETIAKRQGSNDVSED